MPQATYASKWIPALAICAVMLGACGPAGNGDGVPPEAPGSLTLLFAGDLMLGRGVAPIAGADPEGLFRDVRRVVRGADVAMANLESPLTSRPHTSPNPFALEADPALAELVAGAGFDVLSLANNHSGDAGRKAIVDTVSAVEGAGMAVVGVGLDRVDALAPLIVERCGVTVALFAFDGSGAGLTADDGIGVAGWDPESMQIAVERAAEAADVVVVSLHGGVEYLLDSDPRVLQKTEQLVAWGADIVWGHGPHVVQPVATHAEGDRIAVVATSLGNLLFDQRGAHTGVGAVLQVMVDGGGVVAHRVGATSHEDLRVHFTSWKLPEGDAGLIAGEWWELDRAPKVASSTVASIDFPYGDAVAAATGRVTGDDPQDLVVSFRHIGREHPVRTALGAVEWTDGKGRTAHLGLYAADDLAPRWVAGMIPRPIVDLAACDGSIALAFSSLDGPAVVATGAARWSGFGLMAADELPGPGEPFCVDIDGDGFLDPIIVGRG